MLSLPVIVDGGVCGEAEGSEAKGWTDGHEAEGGGGERCEAGGSRVGAANGDEVTKAWVPRNTEELLLAIQESDYGVSDDRSSTLASPAIAAYNNGLGESNRVTQPRGQPLREGFHIVKVRAKRPLSSAAISRHLDLSRENLAKISQIESPQYRTA